MRVVSGLTTTEVFRGGISMVPENRRLFAAAFLQASGSRNSVPPSAGWP
jgi:hypothetical protein